jgi:hypothetical protein
MDKLKTGLSFEGVQHYRFVVVSSFILQVHPNGQAGSSFRLEKMEAVQGLNIFWSFYLSTI